MRIDVYLTPGELAPAEIADRTVVVIDVLRATSTIVEALGAGARSIYPVSSIEEALRLANTLGREEVLLCGERKCLPIDGFDLGNSPREFTEDRVRGKTLVMSTTNGTQVMSLAASAPRVLIASFLNAGAVAGELASTEGNIAILCSGRERHFALEDAICAGEILSRLTEERPDDWAMNDGAFAALSLARTFGTGVAMLESTAAGRAIAEVGLGDDLAFCAQHDLRPLIPQLHDRHVSLASPSPAASPR